MNYRSESVLTISHPKPRSPLARSCIQHLGHCPGVAIPIVFLREHVYLDQEDDGWYATTIVATRVRRKGTRADVQEVTITLPVRSFLLRDSNEGLQPVKSQHTCLAHTPFVDHFDGAFRMKDVQQFYGRGSPSHRHFRPVWGRDSILHFVTERSHELTILSHDLMYLAQACDPVTGVALRLIESSR